MIVADGQSDYVAVRYDALCTVGLKISIIELIVNSVKKLPADMCAAIAENGIVLTGGGAELYGMDMLLSKVLGLPVTKPQSPMDCVAKGLARINGFLPAKLKINKKNITNQISEYYEGSKKRLRGMNNEE